MVRKWEKKNEWSKKKKNCNGFFLLVVFLFILLFICAVRMWVERRIDEQNTEIGNEKDTNIKRKEWCAFKVFRWRNIKNRKEMRVHASKDWRDRQTNRNVKCMFESIFARAPVMLWTTISIAIAATNDDSIKTMTNKPIDFESSTMKKCVFVQRTHSLRHDRKK